MATYNGTTGDDNHTGTPDGDSISGNVGNYTLAGLGGVDTIYGGAGNGSLSGGDDNDLIYGDFDPSEDLVTNGTFTRTGGAFTIAGWNSINPTTGSGPFYSGTYVALNASAVSSYGEGVQQSIATVAGQVYSGSLRAYEDNTGTSNHTLLIEVLDGAGNVIYTQTEVILNQTNRAINFSFTAVSPNSTIRLTNPTSTNTVQTDLKLDNVVILGPIDPVGADTIDGGAGNDLVYAGAGNDNLIGGAGNDTVYAGAGDDSWQSGDTGNDLQYGGAGNDIISGDLGNDTLYGDDGNDALEGHEGADFIYGGLGDDYLVGADVNGISTPANRTLTPTIDTDDGANDYLDGGAGNDTLLGNGGNDTLIGGAGNDALIGGVGDDWVVDEAVGNLLGGGADTIQLGDGADTFIGSGQGPSDNDLVYGGLGDDSITSRQSFDTVYGGAGNDVITTLDEDPNYGDRMYGDDGDDRITGANTNDQLFGGIGSDTLFGGGNNDTLDGGAGNDTLNGGAGNDLMTGGANADLFVAQGADTITDFDATTGVSANGNLDNDFVDLTGFYNATTLAAWNTANPGNQYDNALKWLRADQADGILQSAAGLRIQNGGVAVAGALLNDENTAVCFTAGTRLATAKGHRPIEKLRVGDLVETADHGLQPIRWIGSMTADGTGEQAPILISAGALGNRRDITVSPLHRMLVAGWKVELLFGEDEVIAAAKMLVDGKAIRPQPMPEVTYYHILFDAHEIVFAEGAGAESFHPGEEGFDALGARAQDEITALLPHIAGGNFAAYGPSARRSLRAHEARLLQMGRKMEDTGQMQIAPRKKAVAAR